MDIIHLGRGARIFRGRAFRVTVQSAVVEKAQCNDAMPSSVRRLHWELLRPVIQSLAPLIINPFPTHLFPLLLFLATIAACSSGLLENRQDDSKMITRY